MTLPSFDDYLLDLQVNNYSKETIYNYERDLLVFYSFLSDNNLSFKKLTKKSINQYKAYLHSVDRKTATDKKTTVHLSSYSVNRCLSSLRSYFKFLVDNDFPVPVSPDAIKLVKTDRKHPQIAEMHELISLIEAPTDYEKNKLVALRNRAMLETLFATGMRISELTNLNRSQIDASGRIFIKGKGRKERFVYLTPRALKCIGEYLESRTDQSEALFIPYNGTRYKNTKDRRISNNYLQERIKTYREYLQINVPISAHSLRHGFATYLAENGANPAAIQILLGHESLDTTTRYVNTSDRYAEETHVKHHPLRK